MSDDVTVEEIAEGLLCLAKLILLARKIFPGWVPDLLELEDDLNDLHQEIR